MKKFTIELCIETRQSVFYEVEAESKNDLDKMLETNCVEDIGRCIDETSPEEYNEEIVGIVEQED